MRLFSRFEFKFGHDGDLRDLFVDLKKYLDDYGTTATTEGGGLFKLTPGQTNLVIPFGGVTAASTVVIIAEDDILISYLNGVDLSAMNPPLSVRGIAGDVSTGALSTVAEQRQPGIWFMRGKFTSLKISNPDLINPAKCRIILVGEAT
jgi:hypothetical protein